MNKVAVLHTTQQPSENAFHRGLKATLIHSAVFAGGGVLMALEVLAFLLMARTFGGAWREVTAVIAVFLMAMSFGYWLGGRLGDRYPHARTLACTMGLGGVLIMFLPPAESRIAKAIFDSSLPLAVHSLVASVLVYLPPVLLLSTISPIAIRLRADSVGKTGSRTGSVLALSTAGSLVGTLASGYVLVDVFEVSKIIFFLGGFTVLLSCLVWLTHRRQLANAVVVLVASPCLWSATACAETKVLYERQTPYHYIVVTDENGIRRLDFNNRIQSTMNVNDPMSGFMEYLDYLHCAFLFNEEIKDVLIVGLGGAAGPKMLLRDYPEVKVDVVELDRGVVEVAGKFFGMKDDPRLTVHVQDGRAFIKRAPKKYDLIFVDAYSASKYGLTVPRHLTTQEFMKEVYAQLTPNGILIYNVASNSNNPLSRMNLALQRTVGSVFPSRFSWDVKTTVNTMLVALKTKHTATREELIARARDLVQRKKVKIADFPLRVERLHSEPYPSDNAILLTDEYAPVHLLMFED